MATPAIATVSLYAPILASNAIFSARRASRGADALEENPLYAVANFNIAAAQTLKGLRAAKSIVEPPAILVEGAAKAIKKSSIENSVLKSANKLLNFTADNINPVIIATGALKVAGSEDKVDAYARESTSLLCMFGAEAMAKSFVGMPLSQKLNGKVVTTSRTGGYSKLLTKCFTKEQNKAIKDFVASKSYMKYLVGGIKGMLFVCASIAGYYIGSKIADAILPKKKENKAKA